MSENTISTFFCLLGISFFIGLLVGLYSPRPGDLKQSHAREKMRCERHEISSEESIPAIVHTKQESEEVRNRVLKIGCEPHIYTKKDGTTDWARSTSCHNGLEVMPNVAPTIRYKDL